MLIYCVSRQADRSNNKVLYFKHTAEPLHYLDFTAVDSIDSSVDCGLNISNEIPANSSRPEYRRLLDKTKGLPCS